MPTLEQCTSCTQVCQDLTSFYIPINLVRLDERTKNIYIFAGQETEIEIAPDGNWEFLLA